MKFAFTHSVHSFMHFVLSLPIRNWNCMMCARIGTKVPVLSLPIRNWNTIALIELIATVTVLSLPIRNWNKYKFFRPGVSFASFESTYKELKLEFIFSYIQMRYGFESTYKELKLYPAIFYLPWSFCFESTYKELKSIFFGI